MKPRPAAVITVVVGLLAVLGLAYAGLSSPPRSLDAGTRDVAQTLRCLTCIGEDVADSTAPMAEAMRTTIGEQLEQGRSADEIREWFADRYGPAVLLEPPMTGRGGLIWLLPALLVGGGAWALLRQRERRRRVVPVVGAVFLAGMVLLLWRVPSPDIALAEETADPAQVTETLLTTAVDEDPGNTDLRVALAREFERQERYREAAVQYAAASRLAPLSTDVAYLQASALTRAGEPEQAMPLLVGILDEQPDDLPSLLLLGTLQVRAGDSAGVGLLEHVLELDPDHPAAEGVRELIDREEREKQ